jgi:hypothetical protein
MDNTFFFDDRALRSLIFGVLDTLYRSCHVLVLVTWWTHAVSELKVRTWFFRAGGSSVDYFEGWR